MTYLPPDPPMDGLAVPKASPESVLAAPRQPVTRWNRRYLAAGAAVLAAIVATAFWIGFGGGPKPPARAAADQNTGETTPGADGLGTRYARGYGDPAVQALEAPGTATLPPPGTTPGVAAPAQTAAPPPVDPAVQQARDQAAAARASSPFFAAATGGGAPDSGGPAAGVPITLAAAPTPSPSPTADVQPANGQGGKRQFAETAKLDDYLQNPERDPVSPWEVKAGTVIPAALITAINSDLPGEIIAQVTEPVYDHVTGRTVLIPQGARLIGQYDSQIAYGQERALIAWNRIVMPNGRSINIGAMEGADLTGASGLHDRVDGHFWQLARGIVLSTVFSAGAASAQDASTRSSGGFVLNSAGSGVSTEATQVGQEITTRDLNRQPTLTVRAGWPLRVLVNKDMILAPYP
ncbi:MAG TPA: TrbI/VirB10 family protein [Caulobacteraceae bacterium]|nr:TrbI/VirB10 family protein [Caulobacteraceae bacterium]